MENSKKLHMIGHGHIDPVWLWQWQEGYHEVRATFRSALDRMNEYDDVIFTSSSAAFYAWVEEMDPVMFAEIQERVKEGRWVLVGGWWIEPDCNIPSGESFVRQGLYGQRYFKEKFGKTASVGFNPDSFGHNSTLPQILKKQGMERYVFMRPGPHEKDLPGRLFWWEAEDGSRVLCFQIISSYNSGVDDVLQQVNDAAQELQASCNELMCFYGIGNHGGGPTIANIKQIHQLQKESRSPELLFSSPDRFFDGLDESQMNVAVVHDELQHHASGCYSAQSGIKRWNRLAENALQTAEKWAAAVHQILSTPYPQKELTHAWKLVLFNQFHDILAGSSLKEAYVDAQNSFGEAINIAHRVENRAIQAFIWKIDIPKNEELVPIIVFNPHSWQAKLKAEVEIRRMNVGELLDAAGNLVEMQFIQPEATIENNQRITFIADVPPLGYQVYYLKKLMSQSQDDQRVSFAKQKPKMLENRWYRLEFDPQTGWISSLSDKQSGTEYFIGAAAKPVVIKDDSDTWSHGVFRFDNEIGAFNAQEISSIEDGPVRSTIRVKSAYNKSALVQDFTLYKEIKRIDVHVKADWHEQFKLLKLQFPVNVENPVATYEIPYGHILRPCDGLEESGQRWVDVSGNSLGVSFLNDGKYSFSVENNVFGLTVLRSPIYAHHDPEEPELNVDYDFMDQGVQEFHYALLPHKGNWREAGTMMQAAEINQPATVHLTTHHLGSLPRHGSFIDGFPENIILTVMKKAENMDGMVLRAYETHGKSTSVSISSAFSSQEIPLEFSPYEIKTILVLETGEVRVVNLLEW
ncbi:MAG: hypothetical protein K8R40_12840 [Anaerolineaceae bacterium]|nr:hypothetical protein [Anaerolineaceae bacterium]